MDLPPLQQQLLSKLTQGLKALEVLDEQKLSPGKQLQARVESITPVGPELRARLLKLFNSSDLSLQKTLINRTQAEGAKTPSAADGKTDTPPPNSKPGSTAQLTPEQSAENKLATLLKQQQLYLVQLKVLGKLLTTLTPTLLAPKAAVSVRVREDGQLQLVPTQAREPTAKQTAIQTNSAAALATGKGTAQTTGTGGELQARNTQAVSDGLKTYLPSQQVLSRTIADLQNFTKAIHQRGVGKQSPELTQLLTRLTNIIGKAPVIEQLTQAKGLQHSVKHSGAFLESHLRQLTENARSTLSPTRSATSPTGNAPTTGLNANLSSGNNTTRQADIPENDVKYNDIKAELLRVQSDINRLLTTPTAPRNTNIDKLLQSLFSFFPGGKTPTPKLPMPQVHSQLASALQPSIFSALARITTLQIRHLIQSQQDGGLSTLGGFLELPVRIGEQVYPLTLNIQERIHEKEDDEHSKNAKEDDKNRRQIKKRWQVFLEFDLDELGTFAGDIRVEDEHVTTQLWVQKTALWQASQQHLNTLKHELENSGITVDAISCHQGKAPEQSIRVQQSLVDIRT